jgi:nitrile hydratase accessory protein
MHPEPSPESRRRVEEMVSGLPGQSNELAFDEPWEVRAFALVVAAHTNGHYPWAEFQQALIASIKDWEESVGDGTDVRERSWSYYEHWVDAFERVLLSRGAVDAEAVERMTREVLEAPPNRNHHDPHYEPVAVDPALAS